MNIINMIENAVNDPYSIESDLSAILGTGAKTTSVYQHRNKVAGLVAGRDKKRQDFMSSGVMAVVSNGYADAVMASEM